MNARHFCTYFDHRYLARGLALHDSLQQHSPASILWVLCLSDTCERALRKLDRPGLRVLTLAELERFDSELAAVKPSRSLVEYYFTCSPCLPRYVLHLDPGARDITYLDSDLFFFADPEIVFAEIGHSPIAITPHRFSPSAQASHGKYGKYNVGLVYFRRDATGLDCMEWWRGQCLDWCFDRLEGDRYADQKYLEKFESLFEGVCRIQQPGANLAPWNIAVHEVAAGPGGPVVDGKPLVFFHFQGIRKVGPERYDSNLSGYGARLTATAREVVFMPYLRLLSSLESQMVENGMLDKIESSARRDATGVLGLWRRFKQSLLQAQASLLGNIVEL